MDKLHTTIRKVLNEGIGYAEDQGYGGFARPVYGGNDNNQGAFRQIGNPPKPRPQPRPEPRPFPNPNTPTPRPQPRRIGMGDRRSQATDYKSGLPPIGRSPTLRPPQDTGNPNHPLYTFPRRIGMGDRRSQPTDYKGRYIPPTVDPYSGYQTRSLPMGGRAEPTDFGGYANPYGG